MESHIVKIKSIRQVTHDVKSFRIEKPAGYQFVPGQATEVASQQTGLGKRTPPIYFYFSE